MAGLEHVVDAMKVENKPCPENALPTAKVSYECTCGARWALVTPFGPSETTVVALPLPKVRKKPSKIATL